MKYTHADTDSLIENQYPKLVRDRIPEIVKSHGKKSTIRILSDDKEYLDFLLLKLIEEATELSNAKSEENQIEELADVYEVLGSILELQKLTQIDIAKAQDQKRVKRGGFKKRLLMLSKP